MQGIIFSMSRLPTIVKNNLTVQIRCEIEAYSEFIVCKGLICSAVE